MNNDVGTLVECFEDGDDENLPKKLTELGKTLIVDNVIAHLANRHDRY